MWERAAKCRGRRRRALSRLRAVRTRSCSVCPSAGLCPARGCCALLTKGWCLFALSLLGVGYWVVARGMHIILTLDALLKRKGQFWTGHKFPCLSVNGSHSAPALSLAVSPKTAGTAVLPEWQCSLLVHSPSSWQREGLFLLLVSLLAFLQGIRALLSPGAGRAISCPGVEAGFTCVPPGCTAAAAHGSHRLSWCCNTRLAGEDTRACSCWEKAFCTKTLLSRSVVS